MKSKLKIKRGSGNVFEDLRFSPGEAENLQLRAELMSKIRAEVRDMTQAQAAKRFGVSQPRINDPDAREDRKVQPRCAREDAGRCWVAR